MSTQDKALAYFEALDASNLDKVGKILEEAQKDVTLEAAIMFLHGKIDDESDVPYCRQIIEWREREQKQV
jgi:hypothetical protein